VGPVLPIVLGWPEAAAFSPDTQERLRSLAAVTYGPGAAFSSLLVFVKDTVTVVAEKITEAGWPRVPAARPRALSPADVARAGGIVEITLRRLVRATRRGAPERGVPGWPEFSTGLIVELARDIVRSRLMRSGSGNG
jgi:hypothetical protein